MQIKLFGKRGAGKHVLIDDADYSLVCSHKWYLDSNGYAQNRFGKRMHRIITNYPGEVDHINRNKLDNRRSNLRNANRSLNNFNRSLQRNNKSGVKGVSWCKYKNKWRAQIMIDKKYISLGYFFDIDGAKKARLLGEMKYAKC